MGDRTDRIIALVVALAMFAGITACEVRLWNECRAEHSRAYCVRVLG